MSGEPETLKAVLIAV
jgi:hypothetical protein